MTTDTSRLKSAELDAVLRLGVREVLAAGDFRTAFEAFLSGVSRQAPEFSSQLPPGTERAIGLTLFREIWNHTPRPELGWKRQSLPKPERNGPCPCGSGAKYKQCCGPLQAAVPNSWEGFSVLSYVLETVPIAQFGSMSFRQLDPEEVAHVANEWQEDGRVEPATLLLEGLLAADSKLDGRHEWAFDILCGLYLDAGRDADRLALVERLMQVPDKPLRAAAWQRRAALLADCGEHDQAWEVFGEALRLDPDNPTLAHLELILLANQGRYHEVRSRAAFWAERLTRLGYADEPIVELMHDVARDADVLRAMLDDYAEGEMVDAAPEDVATLQALIENLPLPSSLYRLAPQGDSAGPLQPTPELSALEREWADLRWNDAEEGDPWSDTRWLDWLLNHPQAWQSFDVLEAVVDAFNERLALEYPDEQAEAMEEALLDHAVDVLREILSANEAEGLRLEWERTENRPALRLLMQRIDIAQDSPQELPLLEWLLTLDPNDNGGYRQRLVHAYCEGGRPADALALCERYRRDFLAGVLYGRVLALYLLDRRGDAVAALAEAVKRLPKVLDMLVAKNPKAPPMTPGQVTHGGRDEAWLYRIESLETWQRCKALEWLVGMSGRNR